ncbi:MAG: extracellular solute-binding protein [Erysipelotrichaceae bacterium]
MNKVLKFLVVSMLLVSMLVGCAPKSVGGGKLVVYSPNSDGEIEGILMYFGDKYDIEIELQSMGTGEVLSKLAAEKENPQADVMFGGMNLGVYNNNKDLFQEYVAKGDDKLPEGYRNKTGFFTNYLLSGSNLLVNTDLETELGLDIKGYADLLDPKLKGRIASGDPTKSSSAWAQLSNILLVMGGYDSKKAWDFVEDLAEQLDGKMLGSSSQVYKGVSAGEYVVGLTYEDPSVSLIASGAKNLRVVYPEEGAVWLPAASAIVAGAENVDNAKLFMDFLITDECQTIIAGLTNRPVNTTIVQTNEFMKPFSEINLVFEDIEYVASKKTEYQAFWTEIWADSNK